MNDLLAMFAFPFIVLLLGNVGTLFTIKSIPTWYKGLKKPYLNPPNWIFGPVWTLLYIIIGVSGYLIWKEDQDFFGKNSYALAIYGIQLLLNYLWTPLFFGLHKLFISFVEILLLDFVIYINIKEFYAINKTAAYLLIPYFAWVSFASFLNFRLWRLNSGEARQSKKD
jgi:benzodiazapine receptor